MSARSSARVRRPWLLNLYPRAWRRRYGDEVADMLAGRAFSLRTSVDLVAGLTAFMLAAGWVAGKL